MDRFEFQLIFSLLYAVSMNDAFPPFDFGILNYNISEAGKKECFAELGCFSNDGLWSSMRRPSILMPLPADPKVIDTKIYFFSRNKYYPVEVELWPKISLSGTDFDHRRERTVFITHGFTENGLAEWLIEMKDAFLKRMDANVFLVDWQNGAKLINYFQATSNTRMVGAEIGRFMAHLVLRKKQKARKIYLIGHSLGSHIMAYAANFLESKAAKVGRITEDIGFQIIRNMEFSQCNTVKDFCLFLFEKLDNAQKGETLFRTNIKDGINDTQKVYINSHSIHPQHHDTNNFSVVNMNFSGLDPAQPLFETENEIVKLDRTDANFVDIIHTDARPTIPLLGFGIIESLGHVDFYVNGGYNQPDCLRTPPMTVPSITALGKLAVETIATLVSCSHGKSIKYFTSALNNSDCGFAGRKISKTERYTLLFSQGIGAFLTRLTILRPCKKKEPCTMMGLETEEIPVRGWFAPVTKSEPPYCDSSHHFKKIKRILLGLGKMFKINPGY